MLIAELRTSSITFETIVKIVAHSVLDMPEPVSTKMLPAVPASNHDDMVSKPLPFQHSSNQHAGTGFTVIIFDRA